MYGKIYPSFFTGSMYGSGIENFAVMSYCITNGRVDDGDQVELNPKLLAGMFGCAEELIVKAILYLCAPDPSSRTPDEGGRRLIKTGSFSYRVVNLQKYRSSDMDDTRRLYWREYRRKKRAKYTQTTHKTGTVHMNASTVQVNVHHGDADADGDAVPLLSESKDRVLEQPVTTQEEPAPVEKVKQISPAETVYQIYPKKVGKPAALKAIGKAIVNHGMETVLAAVTRFSEAWAGATEEDRQFCPHPATWFNQERFNDAPETWKRNAAPTRNRAGAENSRNAGICRGTTDYAETARRIQAKTMERAMAPAQNGAPSPA